MDDISEGFVFAISEQLRRTMIDASASSEKIATHAQAQSTMQGVQAQNITPAQANQPDEANLGQAVRSAHIHAHQPAPGMDHVDDVGFSVRPDGPYVRTSNQFFSEQGETSKSEQQQQSESASVSTFSLCSHAAKHQSVRGRQEAETGIQGSHASRPRQAFVQVSQNFFSEPSQHKREAAAGAGIDQWQSADKATTFGPFDATSRGCAPETTDATQECVAEREPPMSGPFVSTSSHFFSKCVPVLSAVQPETAHAAEVTKKSSNGCSVEASQDTPCQQVTDGPTQATHRRDDFSQAEHCGLTQQPSKAFVKTSSSFFMPDREGLGQRASSVQRETAKQDAMFVPQGQQETSQPTSGPFVGTSQSYFTEQGGVGRAKASGHASSGPFVRTSGSFFGNRPGDREEEKRSVCGSEASGGPFVRTSGSFFAEGVAGGMQPKEDHDYGHGPSVKTPGSFPAESAGEQQGKSPAFGAKEETGPSASPWRPSGIIFPNQCAEERLSAQPVAVSGASCGSFMGTPGKFSAVHAGGGQQGQHSIPSQQASFESHGLFPNTSAALFAQQAAGELCSSAQACVRTSKFYFDGGVMGADSEQVRSDKRYCSSDASAVMQQSGSTDSAQSNLGTRPPDAEHTHSSADEHAFHEPKEDGELQNKEEHHVFLRRSAARRSSKCIGSMAKRKHKVSIAKPIAGGATFNFQRPDGVLPEASGELPLEAKYEGQELEAYQKLVRMAGREAVERLFSQNDGKLPSAVLRTVQFKQKEPLTAEERREKGNELFRKGDMEEALKEYSEGLRLSQSAVLSECLIALPKASVFTMIIHFKVSKKV